MTANCWIGLRRPDQDEPASRRDKRPDGLLAQQPAINLWGISAGASDKLLLGNHVVKYDPASLWSIRVTPIVAGDCATLVNTRTSYLIFPASVGCRFLTHRLGVGKNKGFRGGHSPLMGYGEEKNY